MQLILLPVQPIKSLVVPCYFHEKLVAKANLVSLRDEKAFSHPSIVQPTSKKSTLMENMAFMGFFR